MFDTASGEGYVIDFGRAMRAFPDQDGFIEAKVGDHLIRTRDHGHQEIDGVEALVKARFG